MKKQIQPLAILLFVVSNSFATDYYVSKTGSDKNPGTKSAPFLTIQKAADIVKPGDICYISAGIYPESVSPKNSGTEKDPIIYIAASDKDHVVLAGADPIPVNLWEKESASIFKAKINMTFDQENQVFLGEKTMVLARWPNIGGDLLELKTSFMDAGSEPENIVDQDMPDYDYTGGYVWIHAPKYWGDWTSPIQSQGIKSLAILNLSPQQNHDDPAKRHIAGEGADYYVFGIKDALDAENEWFYDNNTKELFVYRSDGQLPEEGYLVKNRATAFDLSGRKYIELHDVDIVGANIITNEESEYILLDGLKILYPYYISQSSTSRGSSQDNRPAEPSQNNRSRGSSDGGGVILAGKRCTIQNSEIGFSAASCLVVQGEENLVFNCYVHDANFIGGGASCVTLAGKGNIVSHNTLTRAGRTVLAYAGMYQALIQNNDMSHSGKLTSDLGLTYGNVMEGGNSEVRYNLMHDNDDEHLDMGLYYDHGTQNIISHHNIIWGIGYTAFNTNHYAAYHLAYNNTAIGGDNGFKSHWGNRMSPDLLECRYVNNIFVPRSLVTPGNYYWNTNISDYTGFDVNNVMEPAEEWLGKGLYIEGITAAPEGTKPGIGAIEYEGMSFKAGHDFENPPQNVNFERSKPYHRNLIENSAFEKEDFLYPWKISGGVNLIQGRQGQTRPDTNNIRMGSRSVELVGENSEVFQQVDELIPGEEYTFIGHLRVQSGELAFIGVRFPDGAEFISPQVTNQYTRDDQRNWRRCRVSFIIPEGLTSVEVFARRASSGKGWVYADDFGLVRR